MAPDHALTPPIEFSDLARGKLAVMMAVYNERQTLPTILEAVLARPEVGELIAIDDGSQDGSWDILQRAASQDPRVRAFRQDRNQGKGAALRRAIAELTAPFAVVQDADLEYNPRDYPVLLEPLLNGQADISYGIRHFAGHTAYSFWFVMGGKFITLFCNLLNNCYISDSLTGYKMMRSDLWRRLGLRRHGFDIDPEITGRVLRLGYRIHEVPIGYIARSREEGKKVGVRDGLISIWALLEAKVLPFGRLFGRDYDRSYHHHRHHALADHVLQTFPPGGAAPVPDPERQGDLGAPAESRLSS